MDIGSWYSWTAERFVMAGGVLFIILGMATLVKDIQPPTTLAQRDTARALRNWGRQSYFSVLILRYLRS